MIPEEFYKSGKTRPVAITVETLIQYLSKLPKDLVIEQGFNEGVQLVVYNVSLGRARLSLEEDEQ